MRLELGKSDYRLCESFLPYLNGSPVYNADMADEELGIIRIDDWESFHPSMSYMPKKVLFGKVELRPLNEVA